jgi:hypothetical protein
MLGPFLNLCQKSSILKQKSFQFTLRRKHTRPIRTLPSISNLVSDKTYCSNFFAKRACSLMYFWRPSMPYDLNVNHIFKDLKRLLRAMPQCFNKSLIRKKFKIDKTMNELLCNRLLCPFLCI